MMTSARRSPIILAIIPARGGSKGIPHKNIKRLIGKPLLQYSIEAARKSRRLTDYMVSTDSRSIRAIALKLRCPTPFLRPHRLATDRASTLSVLQHAALFFERRTGLKVDAVMSLQPTAPLRTPEDIDRCIGLLQKYPRADSVVSFYVADNAHPNYMYVTTGPYVKPLLGKKATPFQRRQEFKPVLVRNGAIYLVRRHILFGASSLVGNKIIPYLMPRERSINIDHPFDFQLAAILLRARHD
ncbi:MAG: acylneuraminate cytidylyltransferase family protein [Elusimicrobiota bacterium]|jgi:CMP-N-acetylneuraminic acid synthetase